MCEEVWKDVPGYEGYYQVSSIGRIKSLYRLVPNRGSTYTVTEKILKGLPSTDGRLGVFLCGPNGKGRKPIHKIVALTFLGECPPGLIVCHNDGNYLNNRFDNLRYDTYSSNALDTVKHGNNKEANQIACVRGHKLDKDNLRLSGLKAGRRQCKACNRAWCFTNRHPEYTLDTVADLCYCYDSTPGELIRKGLL